MANDYLREVRESSKATRDEVIKRLQDVEELIQKGACVYATGSYGRLEAGPKSDLDCFMLISEYFDEENERWKPSLDRVDEIKVQFRLITATEELDLPKFDGGGKYLESHSPSSLIQHLGSQEDDYRNVFTARLLLLLESQCLAGSQVYDSTISEVIEAYFKDFSGHERSFRPAYLLNDIVRMWRTFCVNYEHKRKEESRQKIKSLKLKFCRMITCYSAVIFIASTFTKNGTVTPEDIREMVSLTPTVRLEAVAGESFWEGGKPPEGLEVVLREALELYDEFLQLAHLEPKKAVKKFEKDERSWLEKSYSFGAQLSSAIDAIGTSSERGAQIRRLIVI